MTFKNITKWEKQKNGWEERKFTYVGKYLCKTTAVNKTTWKKFTSLFGNKIDFR